MDNAHTDRNLEFGQFAVDYGGVSAGQLDAAIELWQQDQSRSLAEHLVDSGALTDESRRSLESLLAAQRIVQDASQPRPLPSDEGATDRGTTGNWLDGEWSTSQGLEEGPTSTNALRLTEKERFERSELHAEGGLGKVFKAHDRQLNRTVALKEIKGRYADDTESRERFTREAEITGRLEHPGIVPVYALGKYPDGRPYYAMRMVKGQSLRAAIAEFHANDDISRQERLLGSLSLIGRMLDVCDAIYYAHRRGIVHRDIKPSNIMLGDYGETLVVDWGLAKHLGQADDLSSAMTPPEETLLPSSGSSLDETKAGRAVGSPAFMSPEQARGEPELVGFEADIYGIGATLYMLLTGKPPVEGASSADILAKVSEGKVAPPRSVLKSIPRALDAICMKAMAFDAADRYGSARELRRDLERFLANEPVSARKETLVERAQRAIRQHTWLLPTMAVAMIGVLVVGILLRAKERAYQRQALELQAEAMSVVDPFADNETNVRSIQEAARRVEAMQIPEILKIDFFDEIVKELVRFEVPNSATYWAAEALRLSEKHLGQTDPLTLRRKRALAQIMRIDGNYQQSRDTFEELLPLIDAQVGRNELYYSVMNSLALVHDELGEHADAVRLLRQVVAYREPRGGSLLMTAKYNLATYLQSLGAYEEATPLLQDVAIAAKADPAMQAEKRLNLLSGVFINYTYLGQPDKALAGLQALYDEYVEVLNPEHPATRSILKELAHIKRRQRRFAEAIADYRTIIASYKDKTDTELWEMQLSLGKAYLAAGEFETAVTETEPWLDRYLQRHGFTTVGHSGASNLAFALIGLGDVDRAHKFIERWKAGGEPLRPRYNYEREIAAGLVAAKQRNLGTAHDHHRRAAALVDSVVNLRPGDRAGLSYLLGAILLEEDEDKEAKAKLRNAQRLLDEQPSNLREHQFTWSAQIDNLLQQITK